MKEKKKFRQSKYLVIVFGVVVFLALVQIVLTHRLATLGEKLRQLEKRSLVLSQENHFLAEEIGQMGSLAEISGRAEKIGLVRSSRVVHLIPQIPVAQR